MDRHNIFFFKCYVNAWWQIPVPYVSKLHIQPTNYHLLAAQPEPYKKSLTINDKYLRRFWRNKSQENRPLAEKKTKQKDKKD